KELTKAEEQIMQILWNIGSGFVRDVLDQMEEPKPAYNTVSTIIRILESKGCVGYTAEGKSHRYYPLLSREDYLKHTTGGLLRNYFNNSLAGFVSFFAKEEKLETKELDKILEILQKERDKK